MEQIFHILKFKFISFIRFEAKITLNNIVKNIAGSIIYLAFAIGGFIFVQKFIYFLIVDIRVGLFLLHQFISIVLFIFFITVNLGNIIVSYSTLYKSDEVNYLITKPIIPVKIFAIKFLDNFFYSSSTLIMILISLLAGYVVYFKLSISAFLLLVLNFIPFMISAGSLGVIILLILIRLANRFGIRKIIFTLISIYLMIIIFFLKINSPKLLVDIVLKHYPYTSIRDNYFGELIPSINKFLPNNWLSQSAYWLVRGDLSNSLAFLYPQLILSVLLFSVAMYLGHRWYFKTWLLNQKLISLFAFIRKERKTFFSFEKRSLLAAPSESIIKRDLLMFIREPSQVIHFLVILFLIAVFITSVSGIKFIGLGNYYLQTMIYLSIFLFNLLFISTLSLRFIFPLISLEGLAFWKIMSSPIDHSLLIKNKLLMSGSFILICGLGLSFFSNFKFGFVLTTFSMAITLLAAVTIISINFGMGGLYANYKEKNAIRLSSSQGASLSFLINIMFMLFLIIVLFRPLSGLFLAIMIKRTFVLYTFYWTLIPIGIVSLILIFVFTKIAKKSLQKDF